MDEQGIEIADLPLLAVVGGEGIVVSVGFIEDRVEAAEEGRHGEIDAAMAEICGRVDEYGVARGVAEEVAAPKIAVEQGRWFRGKDLREKSIEALEMPVGGGVEETIPGCEVDLGFEPVLDKKIDPGGGGCILLREGAHIVVFG